MSILSLNLAVIEILSNLKITFMQQFLIQEGWLGGSEPWFRHCYDFNLSDYNILIEVDGNYWHSTPQQKTRDALCETKATEHGYTIYRISEDLLKDKVSATEYIKQLIQN